jgi:hypothetical protein
VKNLLLLSILLGGQVEPAVVPTESEAICLFVEAELLKALDLPVIDPAAPRIIDVHCSDHAPFDAVDAPPVETEL